MFSGLLLDPEFICKAPDLAPDQDPSINEQKMKKNIDFYCFVTSLKNDVNVPSKRNKHKNLARKIFFCWRLEGN
jgi:hypothetical protein